MTCTLWTLWIIYLQEKQHLLTRFRCAILYKKRTNQCVLIQNVTYWSSSINLERKRLPQHRTFLRPFPSAKHFACVSKTTQIIVNETVTKTINGINDVSCTIMETTWQYKRNMAYDDNRTNAWLVSSHQIRLSDLTLDWKPAASNCVRIDIHRSGNGIKK